MDKFIETFNLPRLSHEEIENLNRLITSTKIELVIKKISQWIKFQTRWLHWWILPNIQKRFNTYPQICPKDWRTVLPNSIYKVSITLLFKPDKGIIKKETYKSIFLMKIDARVLNKILAHQFNNTLKASYIMIKWDLLQGHKNGSTVTNQSMWYTTLTK